MTVNLNKNQTEKFNIYKSQLKREWFFSPDGIHGLMHIQRVLIHVLLLSDELNMSEQDIDLLCHCSLYHDIGRTNDFVDDNHGAESCKKLLNLNLYVPDREDDKDIINFIIKGHCINDTKAIDEISDYAISDAQRAVDLFKLFKDCDALDRVRVDHLDINYLRYEQSKKYVSFAWDIFRNPHYIASLVY